MMVKGKFILNADGMLLSRQADPPTHMQSANTEASVLINQLAQLFVNMRLQ